MKLALGCDNGGYDLMQEVKAHLDDLKIEFNKARQGAITQEITEIVSAANAI